jgi:hypothetical protein
MPWGEFISRWPWHVFLTLTADPASGYKPLEWWERSMGRLVYRWLAQAASAKGLCREVAHPVFDKRGGVRRLGSHFEGSFCRGWNKRFNQARWFGVLETGPRGKVVHAHGLLHVSCRDVTAGELRWSVGQKVWASEVCGGGWCYFDTVRSGAGASRYVAKYCHKSGSGDMWLGGRWSANDVSLWRSVAGGYG